MYRYNVVLHYQSNVDCDAKPYMLANVVGDNENDAMKIVYDTMVELLHRANRTRQEIIDAISVKSITVAI